jgi:hypothetical protein
VNVLRDTQRALIPGGDLLDFHPTYPPWARVYAGGRTVGIAKEPEFPEQLRLAEAGMDEAVRLGLFRPVAARRRRVRLRYEDANELIDTWDLESGFERKLREVDGPVDVENDVVFRLYRAD